MYCQEIASGGVILKGARWSHANFSLTRYTFLLSDDRRTLKTQGDEYICHVVDGLWLTCLVTEPMFPYNIILSDDLTRFQISKNRPSAWASPVGDIETTSSISIGNCEKF